MVSLFKRNPYIPFALFPIISPKTFFVTVPFNSPGTFATPFIMLYILVFVIAPFVIGRI